MKQCWFSRPVPLNEEIIFTLTRDLMVPFLFMNVSSFTAGGLLRRLCRERSFLLDDSIRTVSSNGNMAAFIGGRGVDSESSRLGQLNKSAVAEYILQDNYTSHTITVDDKRIKLLPKTIP